MISTAQVCFCVTGEDIDFDLLTDKLTIQPTRVRKKEEWPQAFILAGIAEDTWEYRTKVRKSRTVSEPLSRIQSFLSGKIDIVNELQRKYLLETYIIVKVRMDVFDRPELYLTKENIEFLSRINAEIKFDMRIDY